MSLKDYLKIKKSPEDSRDRIIEQHSVFPSENVPGSVDYRPDLLPVRNQGSQGTCFAQSAATMKEWQEKQDYGLDEYLSPQFFYNNRFNLYDSDPANDEGMYSRDVMKLLSKMGICLEKNFAYESTQTRDQIDPELYHEAKNHTISSYARVTTLEGLIVSLYRNGPCLIAFPIYNFSDKMWQQNPGEDFLGGHAMTVVGYRRQSEGSSDGYFIIRNSWSDTWGQRGYCYYPFSEWGSHWEIWTTVDEETEKEESDGAQSEDEPSPTTTTTTTVIPDGTPSPREPEEKDKKDDIRCPSCVIN